MTGSIRHGLTFLSSAPHLVLPQMLKAIGAATRSSAPPMLHENLMNSRTALSRRYGLFRSPFVTLFMVLAGLVTTPAGAQVCTPDPPSLTCSGESKVSGTSVQPNSTGNQLGPRFLSSGAAGAQPCSVVGSWTSSFGDTWTLGSPSAGTVNFNGRLAGACPNVWPVTVSAGSNQFTATATEPGGGSGCDTTFGDTLTFAASCTSASGSYFSNPSGRTGPDTWTLVAGQSLTIEQPTANAVISYGTTYVATDPITFQAEPGAGNTSVIVSWTASLAYATSAGKGAYSSNQTFSTSGNGTTPITYSATGGASPH
jgi:hypothetical protein